MVKFLCKVGDNTIELLDKEIMNLRPSIDRSGKAVLIVNYKDLEYCVNLSIVCERVDIVEIKD